MHAIDAGRREASPVDGPFEEAREGRSHEYHASRALPLEAGP